MNEAADVKKSKSSMFKNAEKVWKCQNCKSNFWNCVKHYSFIFLKNAPSQTCIETSCNKKSVELFNEVCDTQLNLIPYSPGWKTNMAWPLPSFCRYLLDFTVLWALFLPVSLLPKERWALTSTVNMHWLQCYKVWNSIECVGPKWELPVCFFKMFIDLFPASS